eukprot:IDg14046t1
MEHGAHTTRGFLKAHCLHGTLRSHRPPTAVLRKTVRTCSGVSHALMIQRERIIAQDNNSRIEARHRSELPKKS